MTYREKVTYVAAGEGLLAAKRLFDAVYIAETGENSFQIELAGLGQVGCLAIVIEFEQCSTALDLRLHEGWRTDFLDVQLLVSRMESVFEDITNKHDGTRFIVAQC